VIFYSDNVFFITLNINIFFKSLVAVVCSSRIHHSLMRLPNIFMFCFFFFPSSFLLILGGIPLWSTYSIACLEDLLYCLYLEILSTLNHFTTILDCAVFMSLCLPVSICCLFVSHRDCKFLCGKDCLFYSTSNGFLIHYLV